MKFSTLYDHHDGPVIAEFDKSLTRQEFKDEADINNIIDAYETQGVIPDQRPGEPQYADLTDPVFTDYHRAQNIVIDANQAFERIPARIRERFNNDPASLIAFVQDDRNKAEAHALGLLREDYVAPAPAEPAPPLPEVKK